MLSLLPNEIYDHVTLLSSNEWFDLLVPRRAGSADNAFFAPNDETHRVPAVETREVSVPMPMELKIVYQRYPDDTEFSAPGKWVFLSEGDIVKRLDDMVSKGQTRLVDIGFLYMGMGCIRVLSYDPETKGVLTSTGGGSNGWDREYNHRRRVRMKVIDTTPFAVWWKTEQAVSGL